MPTSLWFVHLRSAGVITLNSEVSFAEGTSFTDTDRWVLDHSNSLEEMCRVSLLLYVDVQFSTRP